VERNKVIGGLLATCLRNFWLWRDFGLKDFLPPLQSPFPVAFSLGGDFDSGGIRGIMGGVRERKQDLLNICLKILKEAKSTFKFHFS
jgi:hypothetical protein